MIKVNEIVEGILHKDEEALSAIAGGYMNYSSYAKKIKKEVETLCKKDVGVPSIVVSLSRIAKEMGKIHPLVQNVVINNITTKSPLSELVFLKTNESVAKLSKIYSKARTNTNDFLTMTLSTNEISVICSDRIKKEIEQAISEKPIMSVKNLASVGLSIDPKYYPMPNITFSLIRRIAQKRIPLAETITTHAEIIFVFDQKYLGQIVELFI